MEICDVAVIGGGAAGLACAVTLKQLNKNLSVIIVEAGERLGKKIAATGNGQGNLSNADMTAKHYHGSLAPLAKTLCQDGAVNPLTLFDFITVSDKSGRMYPAGKQASAISDSLIKRINSLGVKVRCGSPVTSISKNLTVTLKDNSQIKAKKVLLATGGKVQKQFLTDGSAYSLATAIGHSLTPLYPSLVQLKCTGGFKQLKGIRSECRVTVYNSSNKRLATTEGDVIFTDYGLSGNAIFYASAYCTGQNGITLSIEFLPDVDREEIVKIIKMRQGMGYAESELLGGTLHNALGREIIKRCKDKSAEGIADMVKCFPVTVEGSLGFDYAQVTKGGIVSGEINRELESKIIKGLYFAGEILDVDGDCGGYNLHFAFASGMYAAQCIHQSILRGQ
ncbi:MAG: aminoacetone oxidase family FAD-binding enzyme [Candidatus Coproplasma sp.]